MAQTFSYVSDFQAQKKIKPDVKVVKFGDNYEQRMRSGLQRTPQVWSLSFQNRSIAEGDAIDLFLSNRGGVEAFFWTPPDSTTPLAFVCREWQKTIVNGSYRTIVCDFEQVFESLA